MKNAFLSLFLIVCFLQANTFANEVNPFALPETEEGLPGEGALRRYKNYVAKWAKFREAWSKQVKQDQKAVVFLGDSITQGWGAKFKDQFSGMKLANRGIGGDTTRGMLIRLEQDVLSLNPSAIVLLMGTNDLEIQLEPDAIARNFEKIIKKIKEHSTKVTIVLCKVFPSSLTKKRPMEKIVKLNDLYASIVKNDPQVTLLDTWSLFANSEGDARAELFPDLLHLNHQGYIAWAKALKPIFATLGFWDTQKDTFELEAGYKILFNGNDLSGWGFRVTPPRKKPNRSGLLFVEVKEAIQFDGKKVSSDNRYEAINGRLVVKTPVEGRRIQQIWTQENFSGDFILKLEFRATPNADSGVFIQKPQLQCRDFPIAGPYKDLKKYKEGDWNELIVKVENNVAHATCNGELLTDSMKVPGSGPIGLEGDRGQMEYRRIRLKQL